MVRSMKPGSVIVDMAAEQGGNCELTEPGQSVVKHGVTIVGYTDHGLAPRPPVVHAVRHQPVPPERRAGKTKDGVVNVNMEDDAIRGLTVIRMAKWRPAPPLKQAAPATQAPQRRWPRKRRPRTWKQRSHAGQDTGYSVCSGGGGVLVHRCRAPAAFLGHFTVFVLACFIGYMVVWNVTPALHTPLMSVTNAISSIIAIGAGADCATHAGCRRQH